MDTDQINAIGGWVTKGLALFGANSLALIYDHEWIPVALGIDAVLLGVELKGRWDTHKARTENEYTREKYTRKRGR